MVKEELGRSMIDDRNRITLVKSVIEVLKVKPGEYVIYFLNDDNSISICGYGLHKKPNNKRSGGIDERDIDKS